jgi:RloB-like protein
MMVSRGRKDDDLKRRAPTRDPKRRILVVCEGQVTEREYLQNFKHAVRNPRAHVQVAKEHGVPLTVVQDAQRLRDEAATEAKRLQDQNLRYDEVWAVYDTDDHPHLPEARRLAEQQGIKLAISNPCFELWALLHFQDQRASIHRDKVRPALQAHMPGYDKSLTFSPLNPKEAAYAEAVRRAKALDAAAEKHCDAGRNPTTRVYLLTESIQRDA